MQTELIMPTEKVFLVDRDGTLVGTCQANLQAYSAAFAEYSIPLPVQFEELLHLGLSLSEIIQDTKCDIPDKITTRVHQYKRKIFPNYFNLLNWNEELIEELYKSTWAVISNGTKISTIQILNSHPELHPFEIIGPSRKNRPKPFPDMYPELMSRFKLDSANVLVYEDSDVGIKAARSAGLQIKPVSHRC